MKGGVTKRIEDTVKALDSNQLKKALYLTEGNPKLEQHHQWIEEAAHFCLANKDDKAACERAIKDAREKVQGTVTLPIDDTSLEGLEDYLKPQEKMTEESTVKSDAVDVQPSVSVEKTDEELYEECEECHVAVAASRFADICAENPEEASASCELISQKLEDETTQPVDWIKAMIQTAENAEGNAKEEMAATVTELTDYLERRGSEILKKLDKEQTSG